MIYIVNYLIMILKKHVNIVRLVTYQIMMVNVHNIDNQIVLIQISHSKKDLQLIILNMY